MRPIALQSLEDTPVQLYVSGNTDSSTNALPLQTAEPESPNTQTADLFHGIPTREALRGSDGDEFLVALLEVRRAQVKCTY